MPLITGISRMYKNKPTVKRPDRAETPTNGLQLGGEKVIEVTEVVGGGKGNKTNRARGAASDQIWASNEGVCNQ